MASLSTKLGEQCDDVSQLRSKSLDIGHGYINPLAHDVREFTMERTSIQTDGMQHSIVQRTSSLDTANKSKRKNCKGMIRQPKGTLSYTVSTRDSLDSIALHYNTTPSELMRLNRLGCRMIFPGQMLYVPDPDSVEPVCVSPSQSPEEITPINENFTSISGSFDKPRDVPVVSQRQKSKDIPFTKDESSKDKRKDKKDLLLKRHSTPKPGKVVRQSSRQLSIESPVETEYFEKFLKINVKYITDGQGVVSGVLLVTPNAIMFDPNVSDPLVIENGADMYGIITPMEMVISAAMYHDISPMLRKDATAEIYHAANCPLARKKKKKEDKKEDTSENKENIDDKISMNMQQSSPEDGETQCDANTEEDKDEVFFQAPEKLCDCVSENKCKDESDHIQPGSKSQITTKDTASDEVEKLCRTVAIDSGDGNVETRESTDTKLPGTAKIPDKLVTASASLVMGDASVESGSVSVSETLENCEAKGVKRVDIEIQEEALVAVADKQQIVKLQDQCDIGEYVDDSVNKGSVESGIAEMNETMTTDEMSDIVVESGRINTHATVFNADNSKPEDKAKMVSHRSSNDVKQAETDSVVDGKEGVSELPSTDPVPVDSGSESATQHPLASNTSNVKGVEDGRFGEFKTLELSPDGDVCEQKAEIEGTTCDLSLLSDVSKDSITEIQSGVCSDTSRDDDDDDAIRPRTRSFVDFSSGLFAKEQDPSSMVPDITEVIRDTSATQMEIERIKASARRVRITPRNRKKSDSDLQQDRKERTKKQLERLASWDTNYHELLLRPKRMNEPPLYLCLKVGQPMKKTFTESSAIESYSIKTKKPEYWFAVPKDRADHLYAFFVQWSPNIYGKEDPDAKEMGFVVLEEEDAPMEIVEDFFNDPVSKDWEIVTIEEAKRRLSLLEGEELPLPELIGKCSLLSTEQISKLICHLPPRVEGYSWALIYSTYEHGFSLKTLYRSMNGYDSPVLLIIKDSKDNLFGALISTPIRVSDHYYGTGETFLYNLTPEFKKYSWTGSNNFFVKGDFDSLAIGGGDGYFGLWLDGDIYHGNSHPCQTFNNDCLSEHEDFVVEGLEAWGFV